MTFPAEAFREANAEHLKEHGCGMSAEQAARWMWVWAEHRRERSEHVMRDALKFYASNRLGLGAIAREALEEYESARKEP